MDAKQTSALGGRNIRQGKMLHTHFIITGTIKENSFYGFKLAILYALCGSMEYAREVFDKMSQRRILLWNVMIRGYACNGKCEEALRLYSQMQEADIEPNHYTFPFVLKACASLSALQHGYEIHSDVERLTLQSDIYVGAALIDMYGKCGSVAIAQELFDKIPKKGITSWNAMIAGYAQNGLEEEALGLFNTMQQPNITPNLFIVVSALLAYADLVDLQQGKDIDEYVARNGFDSDVSVWNSLVAMYVKCGSTETAYNIFDKMRKRTVVCWNVMITGYTQNGYYYGKCGSVAVAQELFDKIPKKGITSWNAMIAGYAQNGLVEEALGLFNTMQQPNVIPNLVTIVSVLLAYADLADLQQGKDIHEYVARNGFDSDVSVWNSLVAMYAKRGSTETAYNIFDKMRKRTVVYWNAMITGYTQNGYYCERQI